MRQKSNRKDKSNIMTHTLKLHEIFPKTERQDLVFQFFDQGKNIVLHGTAGTGKTFISLYLALREVFELNKEKIIIIRSAVPTRDQGFLPGNIDEKEVVYQIPYEDIVNNLCRNGGAYKSLKREGIIHYMSTSYIRGLNLDNCVVVVDECQNMTSHEFNSVMTRLGENSRVLFCGDYRQSDFQIAKRKEQTGIFEMLLVADEMKSFETVNFEVDDIVRSGLVKEYILARSKLGID